MRPGVSVTVRDTVPPRSAAADTDTFFVAGIAFSGRLTPRLVRSMSEFETEFGPRVSYGLLWDSMDVFFREGGKRAYIARVVGPAATTGKVTLQSSGAVNSVEVLANSPGDWSANYDIKVVASGSGIKIQVLPHGSSTVLEESPEFTAKADIAGWTTSQYVTINLLGTGTLPVVAAAAQMSAGSDDRANITATHYAAALALFTADLGTGQVAIPGQTDSTNHSNLLAHAASNNRVALLDSQDIATAATLASAATSLQSNTNARYGAMFGPFLTVPGAVSGTTRSMPPSPVVAGAIARYKDPNVAAAGINGVTRYAYDVHYTFTDAEVTTLSAAGFNVIRPMLGQLRVYGFRSLAPSTLPQWQQFNGVRTVMAIKAEAQDIAERHMFVNIDGRGKAIKAFEGELAGMLLRYYTQGSLYGDEPEEAFFVDTGDQVNTPDSIADGKLRAIISLRTSPFAEVVEVEIVKYQLPTEVGTNPIVA